MCGVCRVNTRSRRHDAVVLSFNGTWVCCDDVNLHLHRLIKAHPSIHTLSMCFSIISTFRFVWKIRVWSLAKIRRLPDVTPGGRAHVAKNACSTSHTNHCPSVCCKNHSGWDSSPCSWWWHSSVWCGVPSVIFRRKSKNCSQKKLIEIDVRVQSQSRLTLPTTADRPSNNSILI